MVVRRLWKRESRRRAGVYYRGGSVAPVHSVRANDLLEIGKS